MILANLLSDEGCVVYPASDISAAHTCCQSAPGTVLSARSSDMHAESRNGKRGTVIAAKEFHASSPSAESPDFPIPITNAFWGLQLHIGNFIRGLD